MDGPNPTQRELGQTSAHNRAGPFSARKEAGPISAHQKFLFRLGQTRSGPKQIITKLGRKPGPVQGPNGEGNYFPFP